MYCFCLGLNNSLFLAVIFAQVRTKALQAPEQRRKMNQKEPAGSQQQGRIHTPTQGIAMAGIIALVSIDSQVDIVDEYLFCVKSELAFICNDNLIPYYVKRPSNP